MSLPTATNNLGGPFKGYSAKQTINNYKADEDVITRRELRRVWNNNYSSGSFNGYRRQIGPFRAVMNSGDFLSRPNYICGGPNPQNTTHAGANRISLGGIISQCDGSRIPSTSTNVKFVPDSSDYTTFRRQQAVNRNYNDLSNGGDKSNGSYSFRVHAHRGIS